MKKLTLRKNSSKSVRSARTGSAIQKYLENPSIYESLGDSSRTDTEIEFDNDCDLLGNRYVSTATKEQLLNKLLMCLVDYEQQFFDIFPMFMEHTEVLDFLKEKYIQNFEYIPIICNESKATTTSLCSMEETQVRSSSLLSGNKTQNTLKASNSAYTGPVYKKKMSIIKRKHQPKINRTNTTFEDASSGSISASIVSDVGNISKPITENELVENKRSNTGSFSHTKIDVECFPVEHDSNETDYNTKVVSTPNIIGLSNSDECRVRNTTRIISLKILRKWLFQYGQDFDKNPTLYNQLEEFLKASEAEVTTKDAVWRQINVISITLKEYKTQEMTRRNNLENMYHCANHIPPIDAINALQSPHFADALTVIDLEKHKLVNLRELVNFSWTKENKYEVAPTVCDIIVYFNKVSNMIQRVILKAENSLVRTTRIENFIKALVRLDEISNFNGCVAVISGLNSLAVSRLTRTWNKLPSKKKKIFEKMNEKYSVNGNYRNLRAHIEKTNVMIPFIGCFLTQILHINDACPTIFENGRVNFKKCRRVAASLQNIKKCNNYVKMIDVEPVVVHQTLSLICSSTEMTDDDLYEISLEIEPNQEE